MSMIYNLAPRIEHYGCMVDLLGCAKLLAEAEYFIKEMPVAGSWCGIMEVYVICL
jgi:pentatricopeptide repeat protein